MEKQRLSKKVSGIARKRSRFEMQGQKLCVCLFPVCRTITQPSYFRGSLFSPGETSDPTIRQNARAIN
jgi:hypothetical protein